MVRVFLVHFRMIGSSKWSSRMAHMSQLMKELRLNTVSQKIHDSNLSALIGQRSQGKGPKMILIFSSVFKINMAGP